MSCQVKSNEFDGQLIRRPYMICIVVQCTCMDLLSSAFVACSTSGNVQAKSASYMSVIALFGPVLVNTGDHYVSVGAFVNTGDHYGLV